MVVGSRYALHLFPIYTFAQTENGMVLIPSGKLIISTEHGTTEIRIDKFFMDRFEVTQEFYEKNYREEFVIF